MKEFLHIKIVLQESDKFGIIIYNRELNMSKIKFCALGGLGENGKNMYVVTVDNKIFILDAGLKYPSAELHGIDAIIPDITYLIEKKKNICGLFLSHGHDDNIGAVVEIIKKLNVPVYATNFTASIVELMLSEAKVTKYVINRITDNTIINFGNVSVSFFDTTHSIPQSVGISINTKDGSIVYAPDFAFNASNDDNYETSFDKITDISKNKTLLLCPESLGCNNYNRVENDYSFIHSVKELLKIKERVVFAMFSSDLNRMQKVIDLCIANNRRIAIIGRKTQKTVNVAMKLGYMKIPKTHLVNLKYMTPTIKNDDKDLAIIIAGIRHEPYFMLIRMMTGQDKLIELSNNDTVCIISPPALGTEKIATKTKDKLNRLGCKVKNFGKDILRSSHANSEDLKMMYQLVSPKYILPVIGEFRHQYQHRKIALESGFDNENIIMLANGEEITFINGILQSEKENVKSGDILIDGNIVGVIDDSILKDRQLLSESGILVITTNINSIKRKIVDGPKIAAKGFVTFDVFSGLIDRLEEITCDIVEKHLKRREINFDKLKGEIKDNISKEIIDTTNKNPAILPIVIDACVKEYKYEKTKKL